MGRRVRFDRQYRLARIHLEPEGIDLKPATTSDGSTVRVPRLDVHTMVVGELEPAGR